MEHKLIDLTGASLLVKNIKDWVIDQKTHFLTKIDTIDQNVTSADNGTTIYSNWTITESIPTNSCIHIKSITDNSKYESDYIKIKEGVRFPISNDGLAHLSITYVKSGNVGMQFEIDTDYFNDTTIDLSITFYKVTSINDVYISDNIARTEGVEKEVDTLNKKLESKIEQKDLESYINFSDSSDIEDVNLDYYTKADADDRFVQKEYGKVLSSNDFTDKDKEKLERMLEDAPQDHKLYGRMDGEWREVTAFSGLTVALALPTELSDEQVTVIIRYGNTTRRLPYRAGFSISNIPAAEEVTVNIKAPDGYIVPASIKYFAKVNVTKQFIGNIEPLVDGLYVYDIFNQNIKSDDWKIENNADAAGIRIVTSEYDFIWATRFADMRIRTGVVRSTAQGILWGMRNVDVTVPPYNLIDSTQENSVTSESITKLSFSNSAKMIEYMDSAFPNWRTDEVTQNEGFIAAAVAARFTPCEDDKIGDWALSDSYMYHLSERTAGFLALQKSVCGWSFSYDNNNGIAILTNLPKKGTNLYYVVANIYGYDSSKNRDAGYLIVPVKVIRGGDLL